eukprot:m.31641 g.31641  ORF g.31641 m.31641 type:complete len:317 (-) comp8333_c0_seq3:820-1770(-)
MSIRNLSFLTGKGANSPFAAKLKEGSVIRKCTTRYSPGFATLPKELWDASVGAEACPECKNEYSHVRRRKGHCVHCGRLLCLQCLRYIDTTASTPPVTDVPQDSTYKTCDMCFYTYNTTYCVACQVVGNVMAKVKLELKSDRHHQSQESFHTARGTMDSISETNDKKIASRFDWEVQYHDPQYPHLLRYRISELGRSPNHTSMIEWLKLVATWRKIAYKCANASAAPAKSGLSINTRDLNKYSEGLIKKNCVFRSSMVFNLPQVKVIVLHFLCFCSFFWLGVSLYDTLYYISQYWTCEGKMQNRLGFILARCTQLT